MYRCCSCTLNIILCPTCYLVSTVNIACQTAETHGTNNKDKHRKKKEKEILICCCIYWYQLGHHLLLQKALGVVSWSKGIQFEKPELRKEIWVVMNV